MKPRPAPASTSGPIVSDHLTILTERPRSPVTMNDLDRVISDPDLVPQGTEIQPLGHRANGFWLRA